MNFSTARGAVRKGDHSFVFQFSPQAPAITSAEQGKNSDAGSTRNGLDVGDVSDNLELHLRLVCQTRPENPTHGTLGWTCATYLCCQIGLHRGDPILATGGFGPKNKWITMVNYFLGNKFCAASAFMTVWT
jgi:hypothetical protein